LFRSKRGRQDRVVICRLKGLELDRDAGVGGFERIDELLIGSAVFLAPAPERDVLGECRGRDEHGTKSGTGADHGLLHQISLPFKTLVAFAWRYCANRRPSSAEK